MIINETIELLKTRYSEQFETVTISRVNIGLFFTAVQLSSGYCGLANTGIDQLSCCTRDRKKDFGDFSPGKISGKKLIELFSQNLDSKILDIIRLAAINAVSAALIDKFNYTVIADKDPIELIDLGGDKTVCVVGAFHTYIRNIADTSAKLIILELNENAIPEEFRKYYIPAANTADVFQKSDVIIITGSTLANNTIDDILQKLPKNKKVILVGPTAGLIPDILFQHGIDIIGSTRVLDADKVFQAIAEGAAGYHLFRYGAQKICLINDKK
jgi:uncharacterized protein (DUF4213/DUF364 family)